MKNKTEEGLFSLSFEAENFKGIKKTVLEVGSKSFLVFGSNAENKSSLIQIMTGTLDKKNLPSEPIMTGEDHARISHKIGGMLHGEYKEYTIDIYFNQKDKKGRLVVTNETGEVVKSPATLIKSMIGAVSFNPTEWMQGDKKKKIEMFKVVTGKRHEIDAVNKQIGEIKEKVKYKKLRASELEGAVNNNEFSSEDIELYSEPKNIEELQKSMSQILVNQKTWDDVKNKTDNFKKDADTHARNGLLARSAKEILTEEYNKKIAEIDAKIFEEESLSDKAIKNSANGKKWLETTSRPSIEEINKQINDANSHNQKNTRIGFLSTQRREMVEAKREVDILGEKITKLEIERNDIFKNSQLPIPDLRIEDDEIYLNDIPLEEGQVNSAKLMDISIDIAMALNPNYKNIFIHNGNLFDKKNIKKIVEKIEKNGYRAIIEMVSYEDNDLEIKFTETEFKK